MWCEVKRSLQREGGDGELPLRPDPEGAVREAPPPPSLEPENWVSGPPEETGASVPPLLSPHPHTFCSSNTEPSAALQTSHAFSQAPAHLVLSISIAVPLLICHSSRFNSHGTSF